MVKWICPTGLLITMVCGSSPATGLIIFDAIDPVEINGYLSGFNSLQC